MISELPPGVDRIPDLILIVLLYVMYLSSVSLYITPCNADLQEMQWSRKIDLIDMKVASLIWILSIPSYTKHLRFGKRLLLKHKDKKRVKKAAKLLTRLIG